MGGSADVGNSLYDSSKPDERLAMAARAGDLAGVQAALAAGADVHADQGAALLWAAKGGHLSVVRCLLDACANVHARAESSLRLAASHGHLPVVKYLLAAGADVHMGDDLALRVAAASGRLATLDCLIEAGADVRAAEDSALRLAAENGHALVVQRLLTAGASANAKDADALRWASLNNHIAVVKLLRAHGAMLSGYVAQRFHAFSHPVQVALFEIGDIGGLSAIQLARQGVCAEALCVLLERHGQTDLATLLRAAQMLEPLTPDARVDTLVRLHASENPADLNNLLVCQALAQYN